MYAIGTDWISRRAAALGLVAALGACSLNEQVETLYLRQHKVATALAETIGANEIQNPPLADALYAAEAELDQACWPLRHAAYLRFQGEEITSKLEWEIVNSLDRCTLKTEQVEALLWQVSPEIAAYFLPIPTTASEQSSQLSTRAP